MNGLLLAKTRGIEIRANLSVLVIAALIAWSLAEEVLPNYADGYSTTQYWVAAVLTTLAFFAGLIAHELGHSYVALSEGVRVTSVTLWLFGGVAMLESQPATPRSALRIAAAGPIVSLALGLIASFLVPVLDGLTREAVTWFAAINFALALFNLIPAFPMDGGRIYQAWRWNKTGNAAEATERAAALGLVLSAGLIGLGIFQTLFSSVVGGVWLVLIGLFLREAARAEMQHARVGHQIESLTVASVMSAEPVTVSADTTMTGFLAGLVFGGRHAAYPVVEADGIVIGLITLNMLRGTTQESWVGVDARTAATPLAELVVLPPDMSLMDALAKLGRADQQRALVVEDGRVLGIIAPSDISRLLTVVDVLDTVPIDAAEPITHKTPDGNDVAAIA